MKIPKTTEEQPYIEFTFDKNGKVSFDITNNWWGGKNCYFFRSNGTEGNTCKPKDLESYMEAFKKRKIKEIEKEIAALQKTLDKFKK